MYIDIPFFKWIKGIKTSIFLTGGDDLIDQKIVTKTAEKVI